MLWGNAVVAQTPAAGTEGPGVPLVFVHGIKGSELMEAREGDSVGVKRWLTLGGALGLSTPDLSLEPRFVDGTQPLGVLYPGRVIASVPIIPHVIEVDVYGPWLDAARGFGRPFYPFSYDWRRDLLETMSTLAKYLESLKELHGVAPQVVAHSMGGLITLAVLNRRPDLFSSVIFAGVPFAGGIGFLEDMHAGTANGLNSTILRPAVLWTFPSIYAFQPLVAKGVVTDADGTELTADFYDVETWCRLHLGPCTSGSLDGPWRPFVEESLGRAKRLRTILTEVPTANLPPVVVLAGKGQPTLVKAIQNGPESVDGWDFQSAAKVPGDGRVAFDHAKPPAELPYRLIETQREHTEMLMDPAMLEAVKALGVTP